jgi:hypothetical protein
VSPWLFDRRTDLAVFVAPALASLALVALGMLTGHATGETPPTLWLAAVVMVDVAHVWSTTYRVYADPAEVRRRPLLYLGGPVAAYALGVAIYSASALIFWRVLAYAAVFHFVRQQAGWMVLYRRRAKEYDRLGDRLEAGAIYLATIYPLVWWHTATPRQFHWFLPDDFVLGLPAWIAPVVGAAYATVLVAYVVRAIARRSKAWAKHLLLGSTAVCWYVGILVFDSDYVFTVTNVLIHGVPYMALIWRFGRRRAPQVPGLMRRIFRWGWPAFYLSLVLVALVEEGLWDRLVWHDHPQFFGDSPMVLAAPLLAWVVPLLALPQTVHYLLDGFIWRMNGNNPGLKEQLAL